MSLFADTISKRLYLVDEVLVLKGFFSLPNYLSQ